MSNLTEMKNAFRIKSRYVRRIKLLATIGWNQSPTSNVIDQQYRTWTWQDERKIPNSSLKMVRRRRWTASVDSSTHSLMVSHDISLWAYTRSFRLLFLCGIFTVVIAVALAASCCCRLCPMCFSIYHPSYIDLNLTIFLIGFRNWKMLPLKINLRLLANRLFTKFCQRDFYTNWNIHYQVARNQCNASVSYHLIAGVIFHLN